MNRLSFTFTAVAALALSTASIPAGAGVLWQTSHETGTLSDWSKDGGGGVFNTGTGQMSATTEAAHTGKYSAKMEVWSIDSSLQACRIFRWGEHLTDGYFSAWYMFPTLPQVNNWLNIFEFKKKNYSTGQVDATWYNEVKNRSRGTILTLTHWNQAWEIPETGQPSPPIQAGKWFHIEWHYKDGVADGALQIWIDGTLIWDLQNVNTRGIDPDIQWAPCLYGTGVTPGHLVLYLDDAVVSTTRVGPGYFSPAPNQSPVASLSASPTSGTAPLAVSFNGSGSSDPDGTIASYGWNFGDGTSGSGAVVSHTYSAAGTYTATLTVTDNLGATGKATGTITANAPALSSGPVGLWHFDEPAWTGASGEVVDASGNNDNGTAAGAANTAAGIGRAGVFDGVDDHVTVAPNSTLNISGSGLTLAAWVNFPGLSASAMGILSQGGYWNGYRYMITSTGQVSFDLTSQTYGTLVSNTKLSPGAWHHVVATYDGAAMRVYIDGVKDASEKARTGPVAASTGEVWVGHGDRTAGQSWSYPFKGMIDEVQVYDRALSAQEVAALYAAAKPGASNQSPMAALSASPTSGTAPLAVSFNGSGSSDPDGTIASYGWNFGDGSSGSGAVVSHTYSAAGTYTATLTVTDNLGATGKATGTVTVTSPSDPNKYTVDANTVALYHFDGDLRDASPNGFNLSAQGGAGLAADGSGNQVLRVRNLGDQVVASLPDQKLMPNTGALSPLTIEARIFPRAYKAYSVGTYPIVSLFQNWDTKLEVLDRKWSTLKLPRVEGSKDVVLLDESAWRDRMTLNIWHTLKITFDKSGTAAVYVDGVLLGSKIVSMNSGRSNDWALRLGNFDGDIDEVRVSNVARTGAAKPVLAAPGESQSPLFSLAPNYPNPFNPSTTIRYLLAEGAPVRLTVYNALGQEVQVLVDAVQEAGPHSAVWDGRDASGRSVAAGVYFYRLEAGPRAAVGRMVFAK